MLYDELRKLARAQLGRAHEKANIEATALVHEAYVRLVGREDPGWNGRGHFFGAAARAMRRLLVEDARHRGRLKRGGGQAAITLSRVDLVQEGPDLDPLAVDEALEKLEAFDQRKARIVELRTFCGLSNEESAAALGVSVGTIEREWRFLRSWLRTELSAPDEDASA